MRQANKQQRCFVRGTFCLGIFGPWDVLSWDVLSCDVLSLGRLSWDVLSLGRCVLGRFASFVVLDWYFSYLMNLQNNTSTVSINQ